jgi:predicted O-methyltransferase YrrM
MTPELERTIREWHRTSEGWMEAERMIEMAQLVLDQKPKLIIEIGVFGGRSFISQALALKENGQGKIIGIDPWKTEAAIEGESEANINWWRNNVDLNTIHQYCMTAIWKYSVNNHVVVVRSPSQTAASIFSCNSVDILFIDGNHSEEASLRDANFYVPLVKRGGFIWCDDCDWPTTKKMQDVIETSCDTAKVSPDGHYKLYRVR